MKKPNHRKEDEKKHIELYNKFVLNNDKLTAKMEKIMEKYNKDFTDEADEIDIFNGHIVVDNGHIKGLKSRNFGDSISFNSSQEISNDKKSTKLSIFNSLNDFKDEILSQSFFKSKNDNQVNKKHIEAAYKQDEIKHGFVGDEQVQFNDEAVNYQNFNEFIIEFSKVAQHIFDENNNQDLSDDQKMALLFKANKQIASKTSNNNQINSLSTINASNILLHDSLLNNQNESNEFSPINNELNNNKVNVVNKVKQNSPNTGVPRRFCFPDSDDELLTPSKSKGKDLNIEDKFSLENNTNTKQLYLLNEEAILFDDMEDQLFLGNSINTNSHALVEDEVVLEFNINKTDNLAKVQSNTIINNEDGLMSTQMLLETNGINTSQTVEEFLEKCKKEKEMKQQLASTLEQEQNIQHEVTQIKQQKLKTSERVEKKKQLERINSQKLKKQRELRKIAEEEAIKKKELDKIPHVEKVKQMRIKEGMKKQRVTEKNRIAGEVDKRRIEEEKKRIEREKENKRKGIEKEKKMIAQRKESKEREEKRIVEEKEKAKKLAHFRALREKEWKKDIIRRQKAMKKKIKEREEYQRKIDLLNYMRGLTEEDKEDPLALGKLVCRKARLRMIKNERKAALRRREHILTDIKSGIYDTDNPAVLIQCDELLKDLEKQEDEYKRNEEELKKQKEERRRQRQEEEQNKGNNQHQNSSKMESNLLSVNQKGQEEQNKCNNSNPNRRELHLSPTMPVYKFKEDYFDHDEEIDSEEIRIARERNMDLELDDMWDFYIKEIEKRRNPIKEDEIILTWDDLDAISVSSSEIVDVASPFKHFNSKRSAADELDDRQIKVFHSPRK